MKKLFCQLITAYFLFGISGQILANELEMNVSAIHNNDIRSLTDNSVLYTGDHFKLTISADSDMHVSIFNIDSNNAACLRHRCADHRTQTNAAHTEDGNGIAFLNLGGIHHRAHAGRYATT